MNTQNRGTPNEHRQLLVSRRGVLKLGLAAGAGMSLTPFLPSVVGAKEQGEPSEGEGPETLAELAEKHGFRIPDFEVPAPTHAVHLADGSIVYGTLISLQAFAVVRVAEPPKPRPILVSRVAETAGGSNHETPSGEDKDANKAPAAEELFTERNISRGDIRLVVCNEMTGNVDTTNAEPHRDLVVTVDGEVLSGPVIVREGVVHAEGQALKLAKVALILLKDNQAGVPRYRDTSDPEREDDDSSPGEGKPSDTENEGERPKPGDDFQRDDDDASIPPGRACWHGYLTNWMYEADNGGFSPYGSWDERWVIELAAKETRDSRAIAQGGLYEAGSPVYLQPEWMYYRVYSVYSKVDDNDPNYQPKRYEAEGLITGDVLNEIFHKGIAGVITFIDQEHRQKLIEYLEKYDADTSSVPPVGRYQISLLLGKDGQWKKLGMPSRYAEGAKYPMKSPVLLTGFGYSPYTEDLDHEYRIEEGVLMEGSLSGPRSNLGEHEIEERTWHLRRVANCPDPPQLPKPDEEKDNCDYERFEYESTKDSVEQYEQLVKSHAQELEAELEEIEARIKQIERLEPWFRRAVFLAGAAKFFKFMLSLGVSWQFSAAMGAARTGTSAKTAIQAMLKLVTSDVLGDPQATAITLLSPSMKELGSAGDVYTDLGNLKTAAMLMQGDQYEKMLDFISQEFDSLPGVGRDNPISIRARKYVRQLDHLPATWRKIGILADRLVRYTGILDQLRMDLAYWKERLQECEERVASEC